MKIQFTFLLLFCGGLLSFAQISEGTNKMSKGKENSFSFTVQTQMDDDDLEEFWEDYLDDADADKVKTRDGETFADNLTIETVSNNTIDVYSQIKEGKGNQFTFTVWFDLGGAYMSSSRHPEAVAAAKVWLSSFITKVKAKQIEGDLKAEKDKLEDLEDEVKDLEDDVKDLEDDIKGYEKKIAKAKEDLLEKQKALAGQKRAAELQKQQVEKIQKSLKGMK